MSKPAWELVTGNQQFIRNGGHIARPLNWLVRAACSLVWFLFYGKSFRVEYNTGDVIVLGWYKFSYTPIIVYAYNNMSAGRKWFCIHKRPRDLV